MNSSVKFIVIDLFCGAGGVTTGFLKAMAKMGSLAVVAACVNHDKVAIRSHRQNHPQVKHFAEDIRCFNLASLVAVVDRFRQMYPEAKVVLWASLECTNYSKAKGGKAKNADSRSLPEVLYKVYDPFLGGYRKGDSYIQLLRPDYIPIENVVEFMSWGPVDEKGKPISQQNGATWLKWRQEICKLGYRDHWQQMDAANFGAHTSRNRLFGLFARPGLPIIFPTPTHQERPGSGLLFGKLEPWKAVREVLNLSKPGKSLFKRNKPLAEATLGRIVKGMKKSLATRQTHFLSLYYSNGGTYSAIYEPAPVIPTRDRIGLVELVYGQPNEAVAILSGWMGSKGISEIKALMDQGGIIDVTFRMLEVEELMVIQGFPADYHLSGSKKEQKKFIGNAVVPIVVTKWVEALAEALTFPETRNEKMAA